MKKQRKYFFTADTHFFHKTLLFLKGSSRPKDFEKMIIKRHAATLDQDDILVHLGDVIWDKYQLLREILLQIPGTKILVRGNHDKKTNTWYLNNGFSFVCDSLIHNNILFTHVPQSIELVQFFDYNVHGHFHNAPNRYKEYETCNQHRLLALEHTDYFPVEWKNLLSQTLPGTGAVNFETVAPHLALRDTIRTFRGPGKFIVKKD